MQKTLSNLLGEFENGLKKFVVENASQISFTQPQYLLERVDDNHYSITVTITGMGQQHFELILVNDEFSVRGKMIETPNTWPIKLIATLVNDLIMIAYADSAMLKKKPLDAVANAA